MYRFSNNFLKRFLSLGAKTYQKSNLGTDSLYSKDVNFYYPKYETPFEVTINPNYSKWMDSYCNRWALDNSGSINTNSKYKQSIVESDCGLFAAVTFPSANWHRCEKLMKWSLIFFLCDDFHDIKIDENQTVKSQSFWNQINEALDTLLEDQLYTDKNWSNLVRAVQLILREIYFDFSTKQIQRSIKMIKEYINGNIDENNWNSNNQLLPDWDQYWRARMGSVGGQMALQLIEYSKHIELNEHQWNDNRIQDLIDLVSQQIILVNDYYTFRKEYKQNNQQLYDLNHSFPILINSQQITLQSAVNKVNHLIKQKDELIICKINEIETCKQLRATNVLEFIHGVKQFLAGYWRHAVTARRYHGQHFTGVLPIEGQFIYDQSQTFIKPESLNQFHWYKPIPENIQPFNI